MSADNPLTRREREVLDLIGQGKTSKQIAAALNLSVYTVNNHRKHICKKVGLHSTAQLVAFAVLQSQSSKLPS
jgi:DNA-binding CsgD family transcriptional regulator